MQAAAPPSPDSVRPTKGSPDPESHRETIRLDPRCRGRRSDLDT
jgi:hypothetical protein